MVKLKKPLPIVSLRKIWYSISSILIIAAIVLLSIGGLKLGIDFTGGTLHEVSFSTTRPGNQVIAETIHDLIGDSVVQPTGQQNVILRYHDVDNKTRQAVLDALSKKFGSVTEARFESIGPTIGNELRSKALWAIALVVIAIILYISYVFRKVSQPVRSWKYGLLTVLTLMHDVIMVVGIIALLGLTKNVEADSLFVIAVLTTMGYSVHDTIVVYDRVRTNLLKLGEDQFEKAVSLATNQTLTRSINTSLTTTISLLALLLFGGSTLFYFILALLSGVIAGTYSSIFIASPLLVTWFKFSQKRARY